jgi:serine/threonine-protein kinase RsbT
VSLTSPSLDETPPSLRSRATTRPPRAVQIPIGTLEDVIAAREQARRLATGLGFSAGELPLITSVVSELARNILEYAGNGELNLTAISEGSESGILLVAHDCGPGIDDLDDAICSAPAETEGLRLGLTSVRRFMDQLEIDSRAGRGTTVRARKWKRWNS